MKNRPDKPLFIFFDFDGTLVESVGIKTKAFRKLFSWSEKVDEIVAYHKANSGVNRFTKFEHIYKNILKMPLSEERKRELGEEFSQIVFDEVTRASFVRGAEEFLRRHCKSDWIYIVSGMPHKELEELIEKRGMKKYVRGAMGAPMKKSEAIGLVLAKEKIPASQAVMVGDSFEDRDEAAKAGIAFVARLCDDSPCEFSPGTIVIKDLTELESALREVL